MPRMSLLQPLTPSDNPETALERTRCGIVRYNEAVGTANTATSGYHETLTRLWAGILRQIVDGFTDPWEAACYAVEKFGEERDLHHLYYSFDVVRDPVARRTWVTPDLQGPYSFETEAIPKAGQYEAQTLHRGTSTDRSTD